MGSFVPIMNMHDGGHSFTEDWFPEIVYHMQPKYFPYSKRLYQEHLCEQKRGRILESCHYLWDASGQQRIHMSSHPETRSAVKLRKRKSSPIDCSEHADTSVDGMRDVGAVPGLKSPTCYEAFVSAANAVGVLYQTVNNSKEEGARAALIKLYECLPLDDDETLSVRDLKRYLMQELHALQKNQETT